MVCGKQTGHAEAVEVTYDLRLLSTRQLLTEFFSLHDFSIDRRDGGGQYRSAIFTLPDGRHATDQLREAGALIAQLREHGYQVLTEVRETDRFWPADSRHQQYCSARGMTPSRRASDAIRSVLRPGTGQAGKL